MIVGSKRFVQLNANYDQTLEFELISGALPPGLFLDTAGWIYGIAVYTGHQTKVMKNSLKSRPKKSRIELATNGYIILTVLIQVTVCLFSAVYDCLWIKNFGIKKWS